MYGLDTACLKNHKESITSALTKIINTSVNQNTFPSALKSAIVTPVYKSGDKQEVSNQPISILPTFSEVIEKVVEEQLIAHLDSRAFLHPMQCGFRKKYSTETAAATSLK